MTLTLLLDLDDTLFGNPMSRFLPGYFETLGRHLSPYVEPDRMVAHLIESTQLMIANEDPGRTLYDVFERHFFPGLGLDSSGMQPVFDDFYASVFPDLEPLTEPWPEAVALVNEARRRGYKLAVATNPLFPRAAILERLRWAGIPAEQYPFEVISDLGSFHFAKPSPAYFAEVMAQMGWPPGPVLVVGDDPENDIAPARCLDLATFWLSPERRELRPAAGAPSAPHAQGSLDEILPWIDQVDPETLVPSFQQPAAVLAVLQATPAALHTLLSMPDSESWTHQPEPGEWALNEIICHLRDVEMEVHLPRIEALLTSDNPYLKGMDTDAWAAERDYAGQDGPAGLSTYIQARRRTLEWLQPLSPQDWQRPGRHTIFGPTTLLELAQIIAAHDRQHLGQVKKTLAHTGP